MLIFILFEYMYKDLRHAMELFWQVETLPWAFPAALRQLYEFLIALLKIHTKSAIVPPILFREVLQRALRAYPSHPEFLRAFISHESQSQLHNRLRRHFDMFCAR
jgi:hypothetical protein